MGRKRSKMYFGQLTLDKIKLYILLKDERIKQKIYLQDIHPAFKRIALAIVFKYKILLRLQNSKVMLLLCISDMAQKIRDFDYLRGKAFSFFTTLARNFVLTQLDKGIRHNYKFKSINLINSDGLLMNLLLLCSLSTWEYQEEKEKNKIIILNTIKLLIGHILRLVIPSFKKQQLVLIAYGVIQLMKDASFLQNFNKKAIMLYLTLMTNSNSDSINTVLKKISKHYFKLKDVTVSLINKYLYLY